MTTVSLQHTPTGRCLAASDGWSCLKASLPRPGCRRQMLPALHVAVRASVSPGNRPQSLAERPILGACSPQVLPCNLCWASLKHAQHTAGQAVALVCAVYLCPRALPVKQCILIAPSWQSAVQRAACSCCTGGLRCNGASSHPHSLAVCIRRARHRQGQGAPASLGEVVRHLLTTLQAVAQTCADHTKHPLCRAPAPKASQEQNKLSRHEHWHAAQAV